VLKGAASVRADLIKYGASEGLLIIPEWLKGVAPTEE
jgi:hypothetical protein